jgi:hypothetical protein
MGALPVRLIADCSWPTRQFLSAGASRKPQAFGEIFPENV